jgi:hypothetical protein
MPTIDFTDVPELEPLAEGEYNVEVVFAAEGESQSGNPKIDLRYKVIDGPLADRQIMDTMSFHPKALWRTKRSLQAMGFGKEFSGEVVAEDLVGRMLTIKVGIETSSEVNPETGEPYEPRNRVMKVMALKKGKVGGLFS